MTCVKTRYDDDEEIVIFCVGNPALRCLLDTPGGHDQEAFVHEISPRTREQLLHPKVSLLPPTSDLNHAAIKCDDRASVHRHRTDRRTRAGKSESNRTVRIRVRRPSVRPSLAMTNAVPHFTSPFGASGSERRKKVGVRPLVRRSYVRKDMLHPAGVKRR